MENKLMENKLIGLVLMYLAFLVLVIVVSGAVPYVIGNALYHSSLAGILVFVGAVLFGVVVSVVMFRIGYLLFRK